MVTHHPSKENGRASAIAAGLLLLLSGCAGNPDGGYAGAYVEALARYPGAGPATPAMLERFVQHFTHLEHAEPTATEALYAPNLYFSDTLLTTESRAALVRHIAAMRDNEASIEITVMETIVRDVDVYLVWAMTATFTPLRSPVTSNTIGISHLRFNASGQVVLQQDFWDSAAGFYQHVPIIGAAIRNIAGRFEDHGN